MRRWPPGSPAAADLAVDGGCHPDEPYDGRNGNVGGLEVGGCVGELQAEAAVDYADGDADAAVPDVQVGPDGAALQALEPGVVDQAEEGLQEEGGEDNDAEDGVVFGELVCELSGEVSTTQPGATATERHVPDCPRQRGSAPWKPGRILGRPRPRTRCTR